MKYFFIVLLGISLSFCKSKPTYDPFDDQFNVSVKQLALDGCDTITAGCGWFNLTVPNGRFRPFYQVYCEDINTVVAKGFTYHLDTIIIDNSPVNVDKIYFSPEQGVVGIDQFNNALSIYGYRFISKMGDQFRIIAMDKIDTLNLTILMEYLDEDTLLNEIKYARYLEYWKPNPKSK